LAKKSHRFRAQDLAATAIDDMSDPSASPERGLSVDAGCQKGLRFATIEVDQRKAKDK
jgi:hypothetical protein